MTDFPFQYFVRISSRSRYIRLRITPQRGLEVVVPQGYDADRVPALLLRKQRWIRTALERVASLRALNESGTGTCPPARVSFPAVGLAWNVHVRRVENTRRTTVREGRDGQLHLSGAVDDPKACQAALVRWLMRQARRHLVPGLVRASRELRLPFKRVLIRRQKTRWGSCSRDGTISLNAKLLFLSPETVRYVTVHELCHRVELNHSPRFWRLVERHCPDFRRIDGQRRELWKAVPRWADETAC